METKTNAIEVKNEEIVKSKKEQKISISYTLKSMSNNIEKLERGKVINKEDVEAMKKIHNRAVQAWIGLEFKL